MRQVVTRCMAVFGALTMCSVSMAQALPAFEAASVRPAAGGMDPTIQVQPGSFTERNESLHSLVQWAWDVTPPQIDAPSWFGQTRFDIVAKAAGGADESQLRLMVQKLLADRFGLKVHKEPRVMPVYVMTLAKSGPKFQESQTEGAFVLERTSPVILSAHHARMTDLAQGISGEIGRPVVDATGLKGRYEIHMDVSPYLIKANGGEGQLDVMSILFTGLQDLLGLKLESAKQSVDVLVIDHAEKSPTEN